MFLNPVVTPLLLVALIAAALVVSLLVSFDWSRLHRVETEKLPLYTPDEGPPDGLVRISTGVRCFRARVANLRDGNETLILLHGFPQTSAAWGPVISAAANAGFRVIAFDQRGYSPGARPRGKASYSIDKLVADVLAIADVFGARRFHLAGHDWGAAVGWGVVMSSPDRVRSFTALSIPHSLAFGEAVRTDPDQRRRSRYFLLFRTPFLAELVLQSGRLRAFRKIMYHCMPADQVAEYLRVFSEPGALTAVLNWYRAVGLGGTASLPAQIDTPLLFIWGNRDPAVGRKSVELQDQYINGPCEKLELDAAHWLLERRTSIVVESILRHLARNSARGARSGSVD